MDIRPARRVSLTVALCLVLGLVLALVLAASLSPVSAAGALTHHATDRHRATGQPVLVKTAHVLLGNCTAKEVRMRALIARLTYTASQPVNVAVVVHNVSSQTCTYGGTGRNSIEYIGPCGAIPLQVTGGGGVPIWPGPGITSCPEIGATTLAPGAEFTASGTWPKAIVTRKSSSDAPPGSYRLVIDRVITFTITLR
jgi:hypothetical protein